MQGEYVFSWYSSRPSSDGKTFYQQRGNKKKPMALDPANLVHYFAKLKGGKVKQGGIPDKEMKVIKQVVIAGKDAVANGACSCNRCLKDINHSGVRCNQCNKWWHHSCAKDSQEEFMEGGDELFDEDDWWCSNCVRQADH